MSPSTQSAGVFAPSGRPVAVLEQVLPGVLALLREHGHLGVIVLDLEPLAHLEVECGSVVYDQLLARACDELDRLRNSVIRADDVVCLLRSGGEQLAVFLGAARTEGGLSQDAIERVADRLWLSLQPRIAEITRPYGNTARLRLGYAVVLSNAMIKPERLIYRALDRARAMSADHSRRVDMRAREQLRDLIVNRRLSTVFQPILEMSQEGARVQAYEALIRGPDETELVSPAMLFDLAHHADLVSELDRACCDTNLRSADALPNDVLLFANVLPMLINDADFRQWLVKLADEKCAGRLVLELNEGVAIRNHEMLARGLDELRAAGVRIALDDLGSGYANLDHVAQLRPDFLKLDISLIRGVDQSPVKQALVSSLVAVGQAVGATVIAEGIEQPSERDALLRLGVAWGQGFLFGRPHKVPVRPV